ncbi:UbiA family prenyltransferase [Protofrankia symbiont of Coriaria ruscifolia]|uniref:UbiA family prenyltransferase n=1 Tax=Protofrankia symbiont of Coriaria ruscifolia TaxID=1306542 RepID=UPI001F5FF47B|nr:UbiA family prenyltransferase [Protofrankia symbiont of Coriaria ruscifolia]
MTRAAAMVRACHPEPTATVTAVATALAATTGRSMAGLVAVASAVLAGQLSIGWSNDYIDRSRDATTARPDKPVARGDLPAWAVGRAALVAAAVCVPLSFASGLPAGAAHLVGVACGWAYNLGAKATASSVVPYTAAFGLLPVFVVAGLPGHPVPPVWLVAAGGMLGTGAHFANTLPDLNDDERTGVRGLPHRLGARASALLAAGLLTAASALLALGPWPPSRPALAGFAVCVGLATAGVAPGGRRAFRVTMLLAALDAALLIAAGTDLR